MEGTIDINPSQLADIAFKVYNAWEEQKLKSTHVLFATPAKGSFGKLKAKDGKGLPPLRSIWG